MGSARRDAVILTVLAVTIAMTGAAAARALSIPGFGVGGTSSFGWYLRFRFFDVTTEVLVLGALAYLLPRSRLSAIAARVAAVISILAIGAEFGEWSLEGANRFARADGGALARSVNHVGQFAALGAVVAMWFVAEYRAGSGEVVAADLP